MFSKNLYPIVQGVCFLVLIILICRLFSSYIDELSFLDITYWVCSILILMYWLIICFLNLNKFFGADIQTNYNEIRKNIQKNRKAVVGIFLFFQIINNFLFGTLGYFHLGMHFENELDLLCISILFAACWEYFNYFKMFRVEILKKASSLQNGQRAYLCRGFLILIETGILLYQVIICIYFVLLTNQSVFQYTLNSYLKLLFILFVFKILGSSCQKYLKRLLLCASLFALIAYDWYILIIVLVEKEEKDLYFDFFLIVVIYTHGFFIFCSYSLYKEWTIYRLDMRRPRPNNLSQRGGIPLKIGLSDEEINSLKIQILEKSFENSEVKACTICTFDVNKGDEFLTLDACRHVFHFKCIVPWLQINKVCPNCRRELNIPNKAEGIQN